jgi:hypothetical protein
MGGGSTGSGAGDQEGGRILAFPTRRSGLSRRSVAWELEETRLDLAAFYKAHSAIHGRVQDVKDEGRLLKLVEWSGTSAVMGSLDLAIHAMERTADELQDLLQKIDEGEIPNLDEE